MAHDGCDAFTTIAFAKANAITTMKHVIAPFFQYMDSSLIFGGFFFVFFGADNNNRKTKVTQLRTKDISMNRRVKKSEHYMFKSKNINLYCNKKKTKSELEWKSSNLTLKELRCASFMKWCRTAIYTDRMREQKSERRNSTKELLHGPKKRCDEVEWIWRRFVHCIHVGTNEVEAKIEGFFFSLGFLFSVSFCVALVSCSKSELDEEKMNKFFMQSTVCIIC